MDQGRWLEMNYSNPTRIRHYGEQVSGWVVDRVMMREVEDGMRAGDMDLILVAELREVYRNPRLQWGFVQDCVDTNVRFISVADGIDTANEDWELMTHVAVMRHGMTVPEVRRRVRRKASYTFSRGGMVQKVRFGYRKLTKEQAESGEFGPKGLRIAKLPETTHHLKEMVRRLLRLDSYAAIAEWANDEGITPGPYVTSGRWTGRLVKELLRDAVLSGRRRFGTNRSRLVFGTGNYRSEPNPVGPETKEYPELALLTDEEHAAVMAIFRARKDASGKGNRNGKDHPLYRRPRKRSLWPGQHATCAYCGGTMYRYGKASAAVTPCEAVPTGAGTMSRWTSTRLAPRSCPGLLVC
jgi:DNA invertase Pin-like site-specific DNA recombinase